ncbi:uncharacterized protein [Rutidosis leptorrhynchoides]|uniref:uncharacterized protein n=1 Tax=Rutidosis leptorrhynchoides TaxID=125765 RepID=UPI003A98ECFC
MPLFLSAGVVLVCSDLVKRFELGHILYASDSVVVMEKEGNGPVAKPVEDGAHVSISVQDDVTSHSSSNTINPEIPAYARILVYMYFCSATVLMFVRTVQNDKKSPLHVNGVLLNFSGVPLCVTILVTGILKCANYFEFSWMRDIHYTILKCISYCSASLSLLLLVMVLIIPVKLSWNGFLVASVILGIVIADFNSHYDKSFEQEKIYTITFFILLSVPLLFVLVIFLPINLNWIVWMVYALIFQLNLFWLLYDYIKH